MWLRRLDRDIFLLEKDKKLIMQTDFKPWVSKILILFKQTKYNFKITAKKINKINKS